MSSVEIPKTWALAAAFDSDNSQKYEMWNEKEIFHENIDALSLKHEILF